ncbi:MAG TPA: type IV pili twitching motility protein PilT [Candidatus Peribacter riflensis]|uniref:Twitching motility protein PilT n=1 Tax=Candidatus Peribacter riflensis TaxID=1735162 RepID=A0A0S1SQR9_9BACT|nr:MAG: twitching motility protein PilT [Candidatus Peribacter riflensis]ALM10578.1 MAG: twitching motility protein PilT [Candidatus Peribacter riflensis]ALM11680.1 MAG: twitching motility protein PilT [Candidatus Peribacter riflensis]ALM12783.1 MAG: twitching motility protein PilT [Candidatus Peribacter riflensis]ALM13884.1 MAG: twitching motility protein PilT [Candidatus Peribacter riflensis]
MKLTPSEVFTSAQEQHASDVHVAAGYPVLLRIDGALSPLSAEKMTAEAAEEFVRAVLGKAQWERLIQDREIDVSFVSESGVRLRVNCHFERGRPGLVARLIPVAIPSLAEVGLQGMIEPFCELQNGLILLTGPTGSGKSTSLAAMLQHINQTRAASVVTLEDPIEFVFPQGKCVIRQRELHSDFTSFPEALRHVLRQDPNVVMVGEMRDLETIAAALTLAETGHLILATLHTPNAVQTIDRIIDVFPPHQQSQIQSQLSLSLKAVIAQRLVPSAKGGRTAVREILMNTPAVANIIRDHRLQELPSVLQTGGEAGMRTFQKDAERLVKEGMITKEVAKGV